MPFGWHHASWKHLVEDSHCIPRSVCCCPFLLKLESLDFSTKSLQLWFQKCAKHLDVAGWIYCNCPPCPVCKEIRSNQPKRCYITPKNNLLRK
jgi:phenylalanine-4-hydroxylase